MLEVVYTLNLMLLFFMAIEDIKKQEIPMHLFLIMLFINTIIGVYYFGFDAIIAFFNTFILGLILSVGLGGGDVKVLAALALIIPHPSIYYIPVKILIILAFAFCFTVLYYIYLILFEKKRLSEVLTLKIPFMPFIFIAYCIVC